MELAKIEQLLEKYWDGDTTLKEEQVLQRYFTEEEVPGHLQGVAALFQKYSKDQQFNSLNDDFDEALIHDIEKSASVWKFSFIFKIAAAVALVVASVLLVNDYVKDQPEHTAEAIETLPNNQDREQAYEQTRQALLLISTMMNEGTQHMEKLENFSEAQEKVKENIL